ncbi:MAG: ATP-binding protein [Ruminococcus sp.]|nr:ATP-binding protein [Ruminococcus sp.]
MEKKLKLPIGIESFSKIRLNDYYYVDKTFIIADLLNNLGEVNLFTRPRRFGKSLNMDMLKCFFEVGQDKTLFDGLKIMSETALCNEYMGRSPVISVSLKGVSGLNFEEAKARLSKIIKLEFNRHKHILNSDKLDDYEKDEYRKYLKGTTDSAELSSSIWLLSRWLKNYYSKSVVILIDEYDVPLDKAHENGYYNEMANLIGNMLNQALKTNDCLNFAVLTGCLRVSKESIFTGLNNLRIFSILNVQFDEYFGFTDSEVVHMLEFYGLSEHYNTFKEWYDGYRFGKTDVYCPWDVINYCCDLRADSEAEPADYWSNTSGNSIVRKFIDISDIHVRNELETLIQGGALEKEIHQELTYDDIYDSVDNLWSVMLMTGYLTNRGKGRNGGILLSIPNREVNNIFEKQIKVWFDRKIRSDVPKLDAFCQAFINGDCQTIEKIFNFYLQSTISVRDTNVSIAKKENFYHGILLGLLRHRGDWTIKSNVESGDGYSDILLETLDGSLGIVIEVKYAENGKFSLALDVGMQQINNRNYVEILHSHSVGRILKIAVACYIKRCQVKLEEEK